MLETTKSVITLVYLGGQYIVRDDDRLWLLRAVEVEGRPQISVARALVNGFCRARARTRFRGTLETWVRAYAQPVNPRWFESGDLCVGACAKLAPEAAEIERARARQRKTRHATRTEFSPQTRHAVEVALGEPYTLDVTDYAAPTVEAEKKGYTPRSPAMRGLNRLWTREPGWPGYAVIRGTLDDGGRPVA